MSMLFENWRLIQNSTASRHWVFDDLHNMTSFFYLFHVTYWWYAWMSNNFELNQWAVFLVSVWYNLHYISACFVNLLSGMYRFGQLVLERMVSKPIRSRFTPPSVILFPFLCLSNPLDEGYMLTSLKLEWLAFGITSGSGFRFSSWI